MVQAQKTWRKHKAAMILATQSIKELEESGMLAIVAESCPTKNLPRQPGHEPGSLLSEAPQPPNHWEILHCPHLFPPSRSKSLST